MLLTNDRAVTWGVSMMHYIGGKISTSLLVSIMCGSVSLILIRANVSHEAAKVVLALATSAAALRLIVVAKRQNYERSGVHQLSTAASFPLTLTANEVATLLWIMRRGKQRFVETSESIRSMYNKGIIVRPWSGCSAWMVADGIWNERERFVSARRLLPTPEDFPQNGAFL